MQPMLLALLSFWMSLWVTPRKIVKYLESFGESKQDNLAFVAKEAVRVSCVQLRVHGYRNLKEYLKEIAELTIEAAESGAQLVVFPEYVGLFPGTFLPGFDRLLYWAMEGRTPESLDEVRLDYKRVLALAESFQNYIYETYMYTFSTLARTQHIYIAAGSSLFYEEGNISNRCVLFGPDGTAVGGQDKTAALQFDSALGICPGNDITIFDTPFGKLSIVLGSDAYYFENFKIAASQGAQIIIAPDAKGGVIRDILRCRAQEESVYVLYSCFANPQSSMVRAGVLAPSGLTANKDGILICADNAKTRVVNARLNVSKLVPDYLEGEPNPAFLSGDYLYSYWGEEGQKALWQLEEEDPWTRPEAARPEGKVIVLDRKDVF